MNKKFNNITVGADPEVFFQNKDSKEIISAEGLIGGNKYEPLPITEHGHSIQEDNIMAEFNIPPSTNAQEFFENIEYVKNHLSDIAHLNNCNLSTKTEAYIDPKYLNTKQAKMFGCEPDFNVYLKKHNEKINSNNTFRSCGGHIHVGWESSKEKSLEEQEDVIKAMDLTLGLESILIDKNTGRRSTYGKAGNFRFKKYGVEYRTLSSFWIHEEKLIKWAFNKTKEALYLVENNILKEFDDNFFKEVVNSINNSNLKSCKQLLYKINKLVTETKIKNK